MYHFNKQDIINILLVCATFPIWASVYLICIIIGYIGFTITFIWESIKGLILLPNLLLNIMRVKWMK